MTYYSKTETLALVRELRSEAQAFAHAVKAWGLPTDGTPPGNIEWLADRLDTIDGLTAELRVALQQEEDDDEEGAG